MDDAGSQSLFAVVSYDYSAPYFCSIVQLETRVNNHEYAAHLTPEQIKKPRVIQTEYLAHFRQPPERPPVEWVISPPASSTKDLYIVPDWSYREYQAGVPLHGCTFNCSTKICTPIKAPSASKFFGHAVTVKGDIYFMAHPIGYTYALEPSFERYSPVNKSWENLKPFPDRFKGRIVASAVWDDTILLNLDGFEIWAYNVRKNKWYPVNVAHDGCYLIKGHAAVVENTIYALTEQSLKSVLALSIEKTEIVGGDLVFKCSFRSEILVPDLEELEFDDACWRTGRVVHLGNDNFCVVQSCNVNGFEKYHYQPIQLTILKLKGENSMIVTDVCVHLLKILHDKQFDVKFCFSLPECKTTALKEGKIFDFDPFPEDYASKQKDKTDFNLKSKQTVYREPKEGNVTLLKDGPLFNVQTTSELQFQDNYSSQTNIIDEQGSFIHSSQSRDPADTTPEVQEDVPKKSYASVVAQINFASKASTIPAVTGHPSHGYAKPSFAPKASTLGNGAASERSNEEGHSVYVRNLPPDATFRQLEKGLKVFGPIKSGGIQVRTNNMGKSFAFVEFESAASKQRAIKASSPIIIEGCRAVIEEKRRKGKGLFPVDINRRSGSSSSGKSK